MEEDANYKLCGGTFFTLLLEARQQRTVIRGRYEKKHDNLSEPQVFAGLIKVVKPEYIEPAQQKPELKAQEETKLKKPTSNFKNCTGAKKSASFPFVVPTIIDAFDKRVKNEYKIALKDMQDFVNKFIDASMGRGLVERLVDLIEFDKSIKKMDLFYVCKNGQPKSKADLCDLSKQGLDVCLPAFLLGIWHYIVLLRPDNTEGRDTIVSWYEKSEVDGRLGAYKGPKKSKVQRQIKIIGLDETGEDIDTTIDMALENNDLFSVEIINDLHCEIDPQVMETPQNQTLSGEMKKKFKEAIEKYNVAEFMNRQELASSREIFDFVEEIKSKVLFRYIGSQKELIYRKISEFVTQLENYNYILTMVRQPYCENFYLIYENEDKLNEFEKSVVPLRRLVNSLYGEICDGETFFV